MFFRSGPDGSVALHKILKAGQLRSAHRPTRVHLACGDADFRTHSKLSAVCELGRRVAHQDRAVEAGEEAGGCCVILSHDRIGVLRAVGRDVLNGVVHPVDDLGGDDHVEELAAVVFGFGGNHAGQGLQRIVSTNFYACRDQVRDQVRAERADLGAVDQKALG